ncbi:MAG: hypothetical protein ACF8NJ_10060 [Phycisphaerales bacterium JB038]
MPTEFETPPTIHDFALQVDAGPVVSGLARQTFFGNNAENTLTLKYWPSGGHVVRWSSDQPVMEGSLLQAVRRAEKGPPDKYGAVGWIKARAALRAGRLEFIGKQSG